MWNETEKRWNEPTPLAYGKVVLLRSFSASSSEKENSGDVKELLPDGSVLRVYHHHEAESHHHHHEAGSFLRRVHRAIMALGLWEGRAVAFVLILEDKVQVAYASATHSVIQGGRVLYGLSQTPNHQDDNINFKIVTLHSHSVSTLAPQDPLQSLPQPQWDLRVHLPSHILIRLCKCTSGSLCPPAFLLLPATHVGVHQSWLICRSSVINEHTTSRSLSTYQIALEIFVQTSIEFES
ncbi:hypothetical protein C8R48DRAFT_680228 [Suillus tomentosus]|nr:hypothetical protein C8R48DRAFT_680228 [Suillus tomentosus]